MIQPEYITLKNWAASLLIDYADYNIPILYDEKKWKAWGADLLNTPPFRGRNIPLPDDIKSQKDKKDEGKGDKEEWRKWARIVYYVMNQTDQKDQG